MKSYLLIIFCLIAINTNAQKVSFGKSPSKHLDTHLVLQGETWYSISKQYKTSIDELIKLNPGCDKNSLTVGKLLQVPIVKEPVHSEKNNSDTKVKKDNAITHKATKGETVYSISKKYNASIDEITIWNNLTSSSIKEGQLLIVGFKGKDMDFVGPLQMEEYWVEAASNTNLKAETEKGALTKDEKTESVNKVEVKQFNPSSVINVQHDEKGIATWSHSAYDDGNFFALHPTAPKGTVITVKNLMNNKLVEVKVIGKLPATGENENVQIKISESAAKKLNVLDDKFLVKLEYLAPEIIVSTETN